MGNRSGWMSMHRVPQIAANALSSLALMVWVLTLASCHKAAAPVAGVTCTSTTTSTTSATSSSSCRDSATGIGVVIAPAIASINVSGTVQFLDAVSGGTNNVVIWKVNDVIGGNDTVGRIDSNGLYRAPATVPSPVTVNVTVTSYEDQKVFATAVATIVAPPQVSISPVSGSVTAGSANTKTFTATVTGAATTNINWFVNGVLGGNATLGTISAAGVFTAPLTPPPGLTVTITAGSQDFPQAMANATLTVSGYSASSFQGRFAFNLAGKTSTGAFSRAGSFTADGVGNLNSGLEDINAASGTLASPLSFVGTYTIGADGRGTLQFTDGATPAAFRFVLVNGTQLQIIGFDGAGTATGQASAQDPASFGAAALNSSYIFDFSGLDATTKPLSEIGVFTGDGLGAISSGQIDIDDAGVLSSQAAIAGTYLVNSNGRGTATLVTASGNLNFAFYIVSRGFAKFVETDAGKFVSGMTTQQTPSASFSAASLSGPLAFFQFGANPGGTLATAGSLTADGNGAITTGLLDENAGGVPATNVAVPGGTYTVTSNGRGVALFSTASRTLRLVFYLSSAGNGVLQETDSSIVTDGVLARQQTGAFSQASIQGGYAIGTTGVSGLAVQTLTGQLNADGAGAIPSGVVDINTAAVLTPDEAVVGIYPAPAASGRAVLSLNPSTDNRNFAMYVVNASQAFLVGIDTGRVAAGVLVKRF